jgi:hypothetical protein
MNLKFHVLCFIALNLLTVTIIYADSYIAQGEFYYDNGQGGGKAIRAFKSDVVSEVPVNLMMGDKTVTLMYVIEPQPSVKYSVTVSVSTKSKTTDEFSSPYFTKTYQATLVGGTNGPFEFNEQLNGIKFGGVLGLNLRH